jgi:hypothetical protein
MSRASSVSSNDAFSRLRRFVLVILDRSCVCSSAKNNFFCSCPVAWQLLTAPSFVPFIVSAKVGSDVCSNDLGQAVNIGPIGASFKLSRLRMLIFRGVQRPAVLLAGELSNDLKFFLQDLTIITE